LVVQNLLSVCSLVLLLLDSMPNTDKIAVLVFFYPKKTIQK